MPLLEDGTFVIDDSIYPFDCSLCTICKYFHGKEKGTCEAYPNGIPDRFALELYRHIEIQKDQIGEFICTPK